MVETVGLVSKYVKLRKVDLGQAVAAITQAEHATDVGGAQGDIFAGERFGCMNSVRLEADGAAMAGFADMRLGLITGRTDVAWQWGR
jgi:hypothetical protein